MPWRSHCIWNCCFAFRHIELRWWLTFQIFDPGRLQSLEARMPRLVRVWLSLVWFVTVLMCDSSEWNWHDRPRRGLNLSFRVDSVQTSLKYVCSTLICSTLICSTLIASRVDSVQTSLKYVCMNTILIFGASVATEVCCLFHACECTQTWFSDTPCDTYSIRWCKIMRYSSALLSASWNFRYAHRSCWPDGYGFICTHLHINIYHVHMSYTSAHLQSQWSVAFTKREKKIANANVGTCSGSSLLPRRWCSCMIIIIYISVSTI